MRVAYLGHEALTFQDYIDLDAGKTLHAEPGGVYDIAPASGHVVPEAPEPWFVLAGPEPEPAAVTWPAEPDAVPDPEPALEAEQDHPEG